MSYDLYIKQSKRVETWWQASRYLSSKWYPKRLCAKNPTPCQCNKRSINSYWQFHW